MPSYMEIHFIALINMFPHYFMFTDYFQLNANLTSEVNYLFTNKPCNGWVHKLLNFSAQRGAQKRVLQLANNSNVKHRSARCEKSNIFPSRHHIYIFAFISTLISHNICTRLGSRARCLMV